jgi:TetR/AcrR family transcriptional regulator, transcriptional repressor of bet genes
MLVSTMPAEKKRQKIKDIRRVELIHAAHRVFMQHGLDGMTTARICAEAGMSPGILAYYFSGKDEVLFAMVRHNNRTLLEDVIARMRGARTRWDRLMAVLEGNFPETAFVPAAGQAWLSVCAKAGSDARFARMQGHFYARLRSNLASALSPVIVGARADQIILAIGAMLDGLWVRKAAGGTQNRDQAVAVLVHYLEGALTGDEVAQLKSSMMPQDFSVPLRQTVQTTT